MTRETLLRELEIEVHILNICRYAGIETVGELLDADVSNLKKYIGVGPKTIAKIKEIQEGLSKEELEPYVIDVNDHTYIFCKSFVARTLIAEKELSENKDLYAKLKNGEVTAEEYIDRITEVLYKNERRFY